MVLTDVSSSVSRRALVIFVTVLLTGSHAPDGVEQNHGVVVTPPTPPTTTTTTNSSLVDALVAVEEKSPPHKLPHLEEQPPDKGWDLARVRAALDRWKRKEKQKLAVIFQQAKNGDAGDVLFEELIGLFSQLVISHLVFKGVGVAKKVILAPLSWMGLTGKSAGGKGSVKGDTRFLSPLATTSEDTVYIKEWDCKSSVKFLSKSPQQSVTK